jgi:carboxylate-amine ligase
MFDAQTHVANVAALAALAQSLAATFASDPPPIEPRTLIAENKWRAARYGLAAELVDLVRDTVRPAREALAELVTRCRPAAERLGCASELDEVDRICERGEGAAEQRRMHDEAGSLLAVAQWLARTTVADLS